MTALWRTRTEETLPASSITRADLAGTWLVDFQGENWLWYFGADGRLVWSSAARDYVDRPAETTTFTLEGDVLSLPGAGQSGCRGTVRLSGEGRMTLTPVADSLRCSMFDGLDSWPFIRVSPASVAGAKLTSWHPELRRMARDLEFMEDVAGTWLLQGTETILAVVRTSAGDGDYVIDDDGDGLVDPDQWGTFILRADGGAVLRPEGGAPPRCDTVYSRVVTTGATFTMEMADSSCGGLGAERGTWIKLN